MIRVSVGNAQKIDEREGGTVAISTTISPVYKRRQFEIRYINVDGVERARRLFAKSPKTAITLGRNGWSDFGEPLEVFEFIGKKRESVWLNGSSL